MKNQQSHSKNTFKFSNNDIYKLFQLQKGVCSYQYLDEWERCSGASLSEKEEFYSNLYMKGIKDVDAHKNGL